MFTIEEIARVCHEVNRAYCKSIGDSTQKPWAETSEQIRQSAIKGVQFTIDNPTATPADQHQSWMDQKVNDGWVFGDVKDEQKKTHPCIKPYSQLPIQQITKDYLFQAVVKTIGYHITITSGDEDPKKEGVAGYSSSFGGALAMLKDGLAVTRDGWNGKNMFVVKQIPATIGLDIIPKMQSLPQRAKDILLTRQQEIKYTNQMLIVNAEGRADSWVPSVSDLFAEDWKSVTE